jgi:hypothetical protein
MSRESNSREVRAYGANDLILHELLRLKSVSLIPTSDASSYLNPGAAKSILLHEIHHHSYGRISLNELQVGIIHDLFSRKFQPSSDHL